MHLQRIANESIFTFWPKAKSFLENALVKNKEYNLDDVYHMCKENMFELWMFYDEDLDVYTGAMLTEIIDHPRMRVLSIFLLGANDFECDVFPVIDEFKKYAKSINATALECMGREGLEKLLNKSGFKKDYIVMRCEL